MKLEDLGIDSKTGHHNMMLTRVENCFLGLLWIDHVGAENKIGADELAVKFQAALSGYMIRPELITALIKTISNKNLARLKREVRYMHNHLLMQHEHTPILSQAGNGGGYWVAGSEEEAEKFYDTFRQRGLTALLKASRGKQAVMVKMMSQLSFEFENLVDRSEVGDQKSDVRRNGAPTAIAVVDAFLEKMMKNPEQYSEDLKKIGKKFGSVLLPKAQVSAMQEKAQELQNILSGLTV